MKQIKSDEELARLDQIFAEVEAELHGTTQITPAFSQEEQDQINRINKEKRLLAQDHSQMVSNAAQMLKDGAYKTRWERVLAEKYIDLYNVVLPKKEKGLSEINTELNLLRNFTKSVAIHLERAERSAKEQDNHHYYKIFTEIVKSLLEKL